MYRVSFVEKWRKWSQDDEATIDDLLDSSESEAMRVGTALHKALEMAQDGEHETLRANGYLFEFAEGLEVEIAPIRELRASKTYIVDGEPIVITGQVDQIDGLRIDDHKSTSRFDADRYLEGYQWRLYLDIFGADRFRWNVFELSEVAAEAGEGFDVTPTFRIHAAHRLEQCRYPQLGDDCQAMIEGFARFAREHLEVTV